MNTQIPSASAIHDAEVRIRTKVRMIAADEQQFTALSRQERVAVALVLNRHDLLVRAWDCGTVLESIYVLGPLWIEAALRVQHEGWEEDLPF